MIISSHQPKTPAVRKNFFFLFSTTAFTRFGKPSYSLFINGPNKNTFNNQIIASN
jgi:hypothetical protein